MDFLNQGIEPTSNPFEQSGGITDFLSGSPSQEPQAEVANKRAIRWIVLAGNVLPPKFTRDVVEMRMGGENLAQFCQTLIRASNGYLRRCQLTPMTIGYDWLNADSIGDDKSKVKSRTRFDEKTFQSETDYYIECLPGDEIESLLSSQQGGSDLFDPGIREVEVLFDQTASEPNSVEFNAALARGLKYQYLIFPDWADYLNGRKEFFATTPALTNYLLQRKEELKDDQTALDIIDVILESNAQFERYATAQLSKMKDTIEAGKADGTIYSWSPQQTMWFEMLQLNREQFLTKRSETVQSSQVSREEFFQQGQKLDKLVDTVTQVLPAIGQLADIAVKQHKETKTFENGVCAGFNVKGEPCKAKTVKEIDGKFYCNTHPKEA